MSGPPSGLGAPLAGVAALGALWALFMAGRPTTLEAGTRYRFELEVEPGLDTAAKALLGAALQGAGAGGVSFQDSAGKTRITYELTAQEGRTLKRGDVLMTLAGFELRFVSARKV